MTIHNCGLAARSENSGLSPWQYEIRDPETHDVVIEVQYCGVCHSDIHNVFNDWKGTTYPIVPGHEFTGIVRTLGAEASKFRVGDRVGVGCLVDSCRTCDGCQADCEQFCSKRTPTYNRKREAGDITRGGYGKFVVVNEDFVLRIPESLPMDAAAPLLCAGITTYSPIMYNKMNKGGYKIGVIGLGGLGHMAVQFAAAFGNDVTVITRTPAKEAMAKQLGAKDMLVSTDAAAMTASAGKFHFIIDTVSADKPVGDYLALLHWNGVMVTVGLPPVGTTLSVPPFSIVGGRRSIQGSLIGGIKETQEMLDFCAKKNILPMIEKIPCSAVNEAYARVLKSDVQFRFVLDIVGTCGNIEDAPAH